MNGICWSFFFWANNMANTQSWAQLLLTGSCRNHMRQWDYLESRKELLWFKTRSLKDRNTHTQYSHTESEKGVIFLYMTSQVLLVLKLQNFITRWLPGDHLVQLPQLRPREVKQLTGCHPAVNDSAKRSFPLLPPAPQYSTPQLGTLILL